MTRKLNEGITLPLKPFPSSLKSGSLELKVGNGCSVPNSPGLIKCSTRMSALSAFGISASIVK